MQSMYSRDGRKEPGRIECSTVPEALIGNLRGMPSTLMLFVRYGVPHHRPFNGKDRPVHQEHICGHQTYGKPQNRVVDYPPVQRSVVSARAVGLPLVFPTLVAIHGLGRYPAFPAIVVVQVERDADSRRDDADHQRNDVKKGFQVTSNVFASPSASNLDQVVHGQRGVVHGDGDAEL